MIIREKYKKSTLQNYGNLITTIAYYTHVLPKIIGVK